MQTLFEGTDTLFSFNMLARRIEIAEGIVGGLLLVDALANLAELVL
jgi:hypothetical protein